MKFYDQYPMMLPYVGGKYGQGELPPLLLVGESHYLPECSKQHLVPKDWYEGTSSTLTQEEVSYINTSGVVLAAYEKGFKGQSPSIFRNSLQEINESGPRFPEIKVVADYIAFYNFFLRPGEDQTSLRVCKEDVGCANKAFKFHLETLKPSAVIFLSRLAHSHLENKNSIPVPLASTPHPRTVWWNQKAAVYGDRSGREILAEFIRWLNWGGS